MRKICISLLMACLASQMFAALPDVNLRTVDGDEINVAELAQRGKPLIISFFATWCKPCVRELTQINDLLPDWQEETGVEMYVVSIDQAQDSHKVKPMVDGNSWDFHVLLDPNGMLKRAMNVQNVPHVFVLNSKGEIVYNHTGYTDGDEEEIRKHL